MLNLGGINADTSVFAGVNTLRGSYTCHSLDNNFRYVRIPLNHLRKQHKLVKKRKKGHLSQPTFPHKKNSCVPMSAPGGLKAQGIKSAPVCFSTPGGKKNRRADQSVGMRRGTLPVHRPQWTPSLTATASTWKDLTLSSHRAHCAERRKKTSSTAPPPSPYLPTSPPPHPRHKLGLAQRRPGQSKQQPLLMSDPK